MLELYPGVKISIGPPIEDGFYYDFEFPEGVTISEADFPAIEERMREHVKADEPFVREDVPVGEALERFRGRGPGLQGRADRGPGRATQRRSRRVSLYTNGPFTDLCRGPHAPEHRSASGRSSCSRSRAPTGAATPTRTMLTRIYGTAFFSKEELEEHLERLEQAKRARPPQARPRARLFTFSEVSPGRPSGCPPARRSSTSSSRCAREMDARARLREVKTPLLYDVELWKTSGHWGKYRENMFITDVEERADGPQADELPRPRHLYSPPAPLLPRPAACATPSPACCTATSRRACCTACCACATSPRTTPTSSAPRSRSRRRSRGCLDFGFDIYGLFGFDVRLELSTRPEQRLGDDEMWDRAEAALAEALEEQRPRVRA